MELSDQKTVIDLLKKHNLYTKKFLGQNFLISKKALDWIVSNANIDKNDTVIEVGPGLGVLTKELLDRAKKVISIELDKTLFPILEENFNDYKNFELIHGDALRFEPQEKNYKVVANIPYNITSPLISHFLRAKSSPETMTLLVQKEVAEKICSLQPRMTILSLQTALFGEAKYIKNVPATKFFPPPKVNSAIIHIQLYKKSDPRFTDTETADKILKLAKQAFTQKRKKIKNTIGDLIEKTQIDLNRRPETLSIDEWKSLIS